MSGGCLLTKGLHVGEHFFPALRLESFEAPGAELGAEGDACLSEDVRQGLGFRSPVHLDPAVLRRSHWGRPDVVHLDDVVFHGSSRISGESGLGVLDLARIAFSAPDQDRLVLGRLRLVGAVEVVPGRAGGLGRAHRRHGGHELDAHRLDRVLLGVPLGLHRGERLCALGDQLHCVVVHVEHVDFVLRRGLDRGLALAAGGFLLWFLFLGWHVG